jgi:hypothetical protein
VVRRRGLRAGAAHIHGKITPSCRLPRVQLGSRTGTQDHTFTHENGNPVSAANPVNPGESFTMSRGGSKLRATSHFTLTNTSNSDQQEGLDIQTSCSQPLAVGDQFGSLTLTGFNGAEGGNQVTYHYAVINNCSVGISGVTLTDSELGDVTCFDGDMAADQIIRCKATATITQTTTNTVVAAAPAVSCDIAVDLNCQASATVTVVPANQACATGAAALTVRRKEVLWKLTNGTSNKLEISKIELVHWPVTNGLLDEVRLGAHKIADFKTALPPPVVVTTFKGSANSRSIDKNTSKMLRLQFIQHLVPGGDYEMRVEFTNGCSVTFP